MQQLKIKKAKHELVKGPAGESFASIKEKKI